MDSSYSIPSSVLRELPSDPADILAVSQKLATFAFSTKASQGEAELSQVRALLLQRQTELRGAERRADALEAELLHARAETRRALGELEHANAEKATLADTVKSLSKEVAKLDHFKRNLLKTLSEEDFAVMELAHSAASPAEAPSAYKAFVAQQPHSPQRGLGAGGYTDRGYAAPPPDGKAFFRTARARLSPEAYAQLLDNIKGLNAHTRTRSQMLDELRVLFGANNADLFVEFEALLTQTLQ